MSDPLTPKQALAPALPFVPDDIAKAGSVATPAPGGEIAPEDGGSVIADRARFDALSHRDDVPGAAGVREVKFLIASIDGAAPRLYFINSTKYSYHYDFASKVVGVGLPLDEFNRQTYFSDQRVFIAGTILAHDAFSDAAHPAGLFAVEFWPTDPVSAPLAIRTWTLIAAAMPFAAGHVVYHPSGRTRRISSARRACSSIGRRCRSSCPRRCSPTSPSAR